MSVGGQASRSRLRPVGAPVFAIKQTRVHAATDGLHFADSLEVVVYPPGMLALQAVIGSDAFACLLTLACSCRVDADHRLVVDGGAAALGRHLCWARDKTSRVLARLETAGFVFREQHVVSGGGNKASFGRQLIVLDQSLYSATSSPTESVDLTQCDEMQKVGSSGAAICGTGESNPDAARCDAGRSGAAIDRTTSISAGRSGAVDDGTARDSSIHVHDDEKSKTSTWDDSADLSALRVNLRVALREIGFVNPDQFVAENDPEFLAQALNVVRDPRRNIANPGGYLRKLVQSGVLPAAVTRVDNRTVTPSRSKEGPPRLSPSPPTRAVRGEPANDTDEDHVPLAELLEALSVPIRDQLTQQVADNLAKLPHVDASRPAYERVFNGELRRLLTELNQTG